ncbi:Flp pilus assembly protein CpaB [Clostridium sp. Cult2]|uniref:Flp pilus assembly protein CpaB n=1 Tax=Clostridium sp. Cult2 TaxID=2079003 RepID=UPI001F4911BF|nr:Flp pilus assembly protein CpaB [Clostridium sp. Cult2]MCF6466670.1 Flp pilus assembly protein CpaB [Clostridium sp. Cult2]
MKVNKRILLIGVILGLITVFLLNRYINTIKKTEDVGVTTSYSEVVVAQTSIPAHIRITEEMVKLSSIPTDGIHPDAVTDLEKVIGKISKAEIINEEQILAGRVAMEDLDEILSYRIPEDMRAITIPVNEVSGVANYISVGDKIDILATYDIEESKTYTQLQNIEVLELGSLKSSVESETTQQPNTITILVNPEQAEVIAFATINGEFHLTLRNPIDINNIELDHYGFDNFESFRMR